MSIIDAIPLLAAAGGDYQISRSVRLRSSATAYFTRTPSSASGQQTFTLSAWVKRGTISSQQVIFGINSASTNIFTLSFLAGDTLRVFGRNAGSDVLNLTTTAVYRDPSAWYHIVIAIDTTQATSSNRARMYVNGVEVTAFGTATYPAQNTSLAWNSNSYAHDIGRESTGNYFDGYTTEINHISGTQLTPSSFGETDSITGVWKPKKYAGTYGTNGFYLNFSDNSAATAAAIGKDNSGNANNWTPNNISVTAGVTYDSMIDVPTLYADGGNGRGNYCTLNPLNKAGSQGTVSGGNLTFSGALGSQDRVYGSIGMSSGQWYWEVVVTAFAPSGNGYLLVGVSRATTPSTTTYDGTALCYLGGNDGSVSGYKSNRNVPANTSYGASWTTNDVIGVALDMDAGTLTFYKNGTSQGVAFSSINSTYPGTYFPIIWNDGSAPNATYQANFGQRPFAFSPPTGFKALNTQNLPAPTILKGNQYFDATTYTGAGTTQSVTNSGSMQPDLVWIKVRSTTGGHYLFDVNRGVNKGLFSEDTIAEVTYTNTLMSFNTNGFTLGTVGGSLNASGGSFIAWQWKGNGAPVSNTSGTITSQVSAGTSQGFSVVTYTGTGANGTVGHGLGVAPKMIIVKDRDSVRNWFVLHNDGTTLRQFEGLNTTAVSETPPAEFNNTAPTSSVFSLAGVLGVNGNTIKHVAYCFSEVAGFSRFGSYAGNNSTDGPFVFCGFRPRFIMLKSASTVTGSWVMIDTTRDSYNASGLRLNSNANSAETDTRPSIDVLSNGFKIRKTADDNWNNASATYIFAAFAEHPFKNSLAR